MKVVIADAEELIKASASQTGERIEKARARAEESFRDAKVQLQRVGDTVATNTRQAACKINGSMHENPWSSVGIAALMGVVLGMLLGRR